MKIFILPAEVLADILCTPGDNIGCCCFNLSSVLGNESELYILIFRVLDSERKVKIPEMNCPKHILNSACS
jgi:hypothetical protein